MKDSEFEYRMVASNGRASWLREIVSVVCEEGRAVLLRGFMLDITESKQAEAARMQLASIVDSSDDAIIGKTLDGIITSWNAAAERIYGFSAAEIVGKHISILAPAHWVDEVPGLLEKIRDGEKVRRCETVRRTKIGQLIDVALTISPVMDASGQVIGASTIARDITERKCAELALRRNEHELSDFFDNAPVGLHWLGPDGIVLRANSATLYLLGYRHEEYVGHSIAEFHVDHGVAEDILVRLLKNETLRNYEARLRARDGSIRHVLINSNVRWEDGRFVHSRCFIQDITTRRNLEKELLNISDREQGRIGQDLHDDLCQQLAGIGLLSQVLGQNLERKSQRPTERAGQISKHLDDAIAHTRMLARGLAPVSLQAYVCRWRSKNSRSIRRGCFTSLACSLATSRSASTTQPTPPISTALRRRRSATPSATGRPPKSPSLSCPMVAAHGLPFRTTAAASHASATRARGWVCGS